MKSLLREKKINAQQKLCDENNYPHFAPKSGRCFFCGNNIYDKISYERASTDLITSCPHCHQSFCS